MKLPRVSIGSMMTALIVIAIDCAILRSVAREAAIELRVGHFDVIVLALLGMSNVIAVLISRMVRDGVSTRLWRAGFVVGGLVGMVATVLGIEPYLSMIVRSSFVRSWIDSSSAGQLIGYYTIVAVIPFLSQSAIALPFGWITSRMVTRREVDLLANRPSRLRLIGSLVALVIILALPIPVVAGLIRSKLDPSLARRPAGLEAVVNFNDWNGRSLLPRFPKGSKLPALDGARVRIEKDDSPMQLELARAGTKQFTWDYRAVQVMLLDGERKGEIIPLPHRFLKPVR